MKLPPLVFISDADASYSGNLEALLARQKSYVKENKIRPTKIDEWSTELTSYVVPFYDPMIVRRDWTGKEEKP